ncbi:glucokinase, partial [Streptomyces sp. BpilaLS-43]
MSTAATGAVVIGLDLGGTKIAAALFAADGTVLSRHTRPTRRTGADGGASTHSRRRRR